MNLLQAQQNVNSLVLLDTETSIATKQWILMKLWIYLMETILPPMQVRLLSLLLNFS